MRGIKKKAFIWILCTAMLLSGIVQFPASAENEPAAPTEVTEEEGNTAETDNISSDVIADARSGEEFMDNVTTNEATDIILDEASESTVVLNLTNVTFKTLRRYVGLNVSITPSVASGTLVNLVWESSDENVAVIKDPQPVLSYMPGRAKLWPKGKGTATITVTNPKTGAFATCSVTVTDEDSTYNKTLDEIKARGVENAVSMDVYDGRDLGIMTPVNFQEGGICVSEGQIASMETSIMMQGFLTKEEADIYEPQLACNYFSHSGDPLDNTTEDSQYWSDWRNYALQMYPLAAFLTQWNGPVHNAARPEEIGFGKSIAKPEDIIFAPTVYGEERKNLIKKLVAQYGAVVAVYQAPHEGWLYHKWHKDSAGSHVSAIVGWDDTVEPENFTVEQGYESQMTVKTKGAWIVKNSWGENNPSDGKGYFYLSYEAPVDELISYKMMPKDTYDFNYFYDGLVPTENSSRNLYTDQFQAGSSAAASYEAKKGGEEGKNEYLEAVNIGISQGSLDTKVEVDVYTNVSRESLEGTDSPVDPTDGVYEPSAKVTKTFPYGGFYTIKLKNPIKLEKGQYFTVVVKMLNDCKIYTSLERSTNDLTFASLENGGWKNTRNHTIRLKAYTKLYSESEIESKLPELQAVSLDKTEVTLTEGGVDRLTAIFTPENARDRSVLWESSNEDVVTVDETGKLTVKAAGEAEITVKTANGKTAKCKVTVEAKVIPAESVTLDKTELSLTEGDTASLTATVLPETATDKAVTWESSDDTIVSVDQTGKLTTKAPGEAEITVKTANGKTAKCRVTVEAAAKPTPDPGKVEVEVVPQPGAPAVSLPADVQSALKDAVLTPEEKNAVEQGAEIKIELTVEDADRTVTAEDRKAVSDCISKDGRGFVVGQYLDISLLKIVDKNAPKPIYDTGSTQVTIVVTVPEALRAAGRTFAVVRLHDGIADILEDRDTDPDTITFRTNKFSSYTIVYADKAGAAVTPTPAGTPDAETGTPTPAANTPASPGTGDKAPVLILLTLMLVSLSVMMTVKVRAMRRH